MRRRDTRTWVLASILAAAAAAALPSILTDGDSCTNASIARDMATGDWRAWVAPRWAQGSAWTWYREHAPGSYWIAALLGKAGLLAGAGEAGAERAPVVASALWLVAAAGGVAAIVRRFRDDAAPWIAAVVMLLHVPVLKYVGRVSIELPLAACTAWALAGALRLRDGRRWVLVTAAALAAAFLVRGALGGVAALLVAALLLEREHRPPLARWVVAVLLAAVPLIAFDRLHAAVTGASFWGAYFDRQVATSFVEGGTQHTGTERQFGYFASRLLLYSLPWSLIPLWRAVRDRGGPGSMPTPAAWRLLLLGVGASLVVASASMRPASRYLFGAWPCLAALCGLALPRTLPGWVDAVSRPACALLTPLLLIGSFAAHGNDAWDAAATDLRRLRAAGDIPAEIRGPFDPQDARDKAFLRWHLGVRALSGDPQPGVVTWTLVRPAAADERTSPALVTTPFGTLHRR